MLNGKRKQRREIPGESRDHPLRQRQLRILKRQTPAPQRPPIPFAWMLRHDTSIGNERTLDGIRGKPNTPRQTGSRDEKIEDQQY